MDKQRWFAISAGAFMAVAIVQLLTTLVLGSLPLSTVMKYQALQLSTWTYLLGCGTSLITGLFAYPQRRLQTWWVVPCAAYFLCAGALLFRTAG